VIAEGQLRALLATLGLEADAALEPIASGPVLTGRRSQLTGTGIEASGSGVVMVRVARGSLGGRGFRMTFAWLVCGPHGHRLRHESWLRAVRGDCIPETYPVAAAIDINRCVANPSRTQASRKWCW